MLVYIYTLRNTYVYIHSLLRIILCHMCQFMCKYAICVKHMYIYTLHYIFHIMSHVLMLVYIYTLHNTYVYIQSLL